MSQIQKPIIPRRARIAQFLTHVSQNAIAVALSGKKRTDKAESLLPVGRVKK